MQKIYWALTLSLLCIALPLKAEQTAIPHDPCASFLTLIDRPTIADSPCAVKPLDIVIEYGYQYQKLHNNGGNVNLLPDMELRFGLPANNEFTVLLPSYINEHPEGSESTSGSTATIVGWKNELGNTSKFIYAAEALFTTPGGNPTFGSEGWGVAVNGIVSYAISSTLDLTTMIGVMTQTTPAHSGGKRFESFNPDFVLTWQPISSFQIFGEVYGQTHSSDDENWGWNADVGAQYLITPYIAVDIEYGQRLSGNLGGFEHYFGAGGGVWF